MRQCRENLHSGVLAVPEVMLQDEGDRLIDDMTLPQLAQALGCKVVRIPSDGAGTCRALLKGGRRRLVFHKEK